jgi:predicted RNA-binding Zn ribbon-like protein
MKPLDSESGREGWLLADPQLAVDFVDTRRSQGDALAGELPVDDEAARWVREHVRSQDLGRPADLVNLRSVLREVFTAIVDATALPARALDTINRLAEQAPVTLTAYVRQGDISVERTSRADSAALLHADLARSALVLLSTPARERLRLCRAPGCVLFFLTDRPRQQWCSPSCGNRARVARHYRRHHPR